MQFLAQFIIRKPALATALVVCSAVTIANFKMHDDPPKPVNPWAPDAPVAPAAEASAQPDHNRLGRIVDSVTGKLDNLVGKHITGGQPVKTGETLDTAAGAMQAANHGG